MSNRGKSNRELCPNADEPGLLPAGRAAWTPTRMVDRCCDQPESRLMVGPLCLLGSLPGKYAAWGKDWTLLLSAFGSQADWLRQFAHQSRSCLETDPNLDLVLYVLCEPSPPRGNSMRCGKQKCWFRRFGVPGLRILCMCLVRTPWQAHGLHMQPGA